MAIVSIVARIILGIVLAALGAFSLFMPAPPPMPGLAGQFIAIFFQSHWNLFVAAAQLVLGILLLINRYVPVALIMLAAFLYNSFAFHITILPAFIRSGHRPDPVAAGRMAVSRTLRTDLPRQAVKS